MITTYKQNNLGNSDIARWGDISGTKRRNI